MWGVRAEADLEFKASLGALQASLSQTSRPCLKTNNNIYFIKRERLEEWLAEGSKGVWTVAGGLESGCDNGDGLGRKDS